jgi:hypothetical protein
MKLPKLVLPVLLLMAVSLSCKLLNRAGSGGVSADDLTRITANLPTYDPKGVRPSAGAIALRRLAELEPSAGTLEPEFEAVEQAALKKLLAEVGVQANIGISTPPSRVAKTKAPVPLAMSSGSQSLPLALVVLQDQAEPRAASAHDAAIIGAMFSGLSDIFGGWLTEKGKVSKTATETKDGVTSTMSVELGRGEDGTTVFGFGIKTDTVKDGVPVKADLDGKVDGQRCPNAEGQVSFTIKVRIGAQVGETGYTQELTAFVRAVVNDEAKLATHTLDVVQGIRQQKGGRQIYIETGQTATHDGTDYTTSNFRIIRTSQQVAQTDEPLVIEGLTAAFGVGRTALATAEYNWYNGKCTQIEAKSPGTVEPSSKTSIPVTVRQRFEKTEIPSKLVAELKGEASVDPTTLPKTAGTLTYTAPGQRNKSATISLIATSRRGRATLDLTASTGGQSYRVSGQSNGVSFSGEICRLTKPFSIDATFPGGTAKTTFNPGSDTGGTTTVSGGGGGGCTHTGGGDYSVTLKEDGSGSITWTTTDKIDCPGGPGFRNSRTATFTLQLQPAPDLACP